MNNKPVLWVCLFFFLVGCNKRIGSIFDRDNAKIVIDQVDFDYLSAKVKIEYKNDGKDISGIANMRFKKNQTIWMSISPGFGVEVARGLITKDSIKIIDKINKQYIVKSFEELSKEFDFDISYEMVEAVFLGNLLYPYRREKLAAEGNFLTYNQEIGQYQLKNKIGTESLKLEKFYALDSESQNAISVDYSDFQLVSDQILPFQIGAKVEYSDTSKSETEVNITFKQSQIEEKPLKFPFSVPSKYERK